MDSSASDFRKSDTNGGASVQDRPARDSSASNRVADLKDMNNSMEATCSGDEALSARAKL